MRIIRVFSSMVLAVSIPALASGFDFSGQSRTYFQATESIDNRHILPLYEYLDFKVEDFASIASQNVSFHFGGWARTDIADEAYGKKTNNDLQYAYLTIRKSTANAALDLGRVFIREGVVSELKERNSSTDFREEEGGDLWFRPVNWAELLGTSSYNVLSRAWMQHNYN